MADWISWLLIAFIGFSGGIAVGSGFVAFLVMLDLIPRLAQISRSYHLIQWYEGAIIAGALFFTYSDFYKWHLYLTPWTTSIVGIFSGIFIGMLAAALAEVVNVIPILAKRLGMGAYLLWLLTAMILGKVVGSLLDWLIF